MGATGAMAVGLVLDGAMKAANILKTLSETLRQQNPDLTAALAQVGELQQAVYDLQMENLGLKGQIVQLESEKADLKQKIASDDAWNAHLAQVEEFQAPGGGVVIKKKGAAIYYCPSCHAQRLPVPLQPRANGYYACQRCPNAGYQIDPHTRTFSVLQRRPHRPYY